MRAGALFIGLISALTISCADVSVKTTLPEDPHDGTHLNLPSDFLRRTRVEQLEGAWEYTIPGNGNITYVLYRSLGLIQSGSVIISGENETNKTLLCHLCLFDEPTQEAIDAINEFYDVPLMYE
jgi:hypothetical protein